MPISLASALSTLAGSELLTAVLGPLAQKLTSEIGELTQEKWRKYTHSFERYLQDAELRHKYFSSQVFSNEGQLLENYYVPLTLEKTTTSNRKIAVVVNSYPADLMGAYKDLLVVDTAGMGKSTLLKFIFLQTLARKETIPIFVELRKLSREKTILSFISEELRFGTDPVNQKLLEATLSDGVFTFFLDGYDEIPDDEKSVVSEQIISLKSNANNNRFILSSREEQSLASLAEFHKFSIKPLSQSEAFTLIRKLCPDPRVAASLIEKVQAQAGDNLEEFLTNPLLVSLLVKSFLHSPILPVRLSEFYRQVFDALFQNHDAKKELGGFTRKKKSNLDLDRFHKTLRALGALTYQANKLEFSTDELSTQIDRAKALTSESGYSAASFQHDLLHAVPLFVREGSVIRWAHRSLQEYFAAAYICMDAKDKQADLLRQLYKSGTQKNANLLRLCADIDGKTFKHVVVKEYLADRIAKIKSNLTAESFPEVSSDTLAMRRSVILETNAELVILTRALNEGAATKKVKDVIRREPGTGLAGLTTDGDIVAAEEKVKFFIRINLSNYRAIDSIIKAYYHKHILQISARVKVKSSFKNVPHNMLLSIDDSADNPLNSPENFRLTTELLFNVARLVGSCYNIGALTGFHEAILKDEAKAQSFDLKFE